MIHERRRLIPTMIAVIFCVSLVDRSLMLMYWLMGYLFIIQVCGLG